VLAAAAGALRTCRCWRRRSTARCRLLPRRERRQGECYTSQGSLGSNSMLLPIQSCLMPIALEEGAPPKDVT